MIVYITRHGQIDLETPCDTEYYALSPLGRRQAEKLGRRLRDIGFAGKVYVSPFHRCLETAEIVCQVVGTQFVPEPHLCEIARGWPETFTGLTVQEIAELFPACAPDAELHWPWWPTEEETSDDVLVRVKPFLSNLVRDGQGDALLIGHGASAGACFRFLAGRSGGHCNAALSAIQVRPVRSVLLSGDVDHLGVGEVTQNAKVIA